MENVVKDNVEARIQAINKLIQAMERNGFSGQLSGEEIPEFVHKLEQTYFKADLLASECSSLEDFSNKIAEEELFLNDLGVIIREENLSRIFPEAEYTSSLRKGGLPPRGQSALEFYKVSELGKACALTGMEINQIPEEVLLNDYAFILGYINGHSRDCRKELQDVPEAKSYIQDCRQQVDLIFENIRLKNVELCNTQQPKTTDDALVAE